MHVELKFVSFVCMHLKQQSYHHISLRPMIFSSERSIYLCITVLLPLSNQHRISIAVLAQPIVELLRDLLLSVQLPYVFRPLMRDLEDRPHDLVLWDVGGREVLGILHLVSEDEEGVFDVAEACWRSFALRGVTDGWHCDVGV